MTDAGLALTPMMRLPTASSTRLDRATQTSTYNVGVEVRAVKKRVEAARPTNMTRDTVAFTDGRWPDVEMGQSSRLETYWTKILLEDLENALINITLKQIVISLLAANA